MLRHPSKTRITLIVTHRPSTFQGIVGKRNISSNSFSKILSIPFSIDKPTAQESFKKHHSKTFLHHQPVQAIPNPTPVYLPYYIFNATTSLTYSARLQNTTHERRFNILTGRWEYYPRVRFHDIPSQTLSNIEYPATLHAMHVYAGYSQIPTWLKDLETQDVLRLARYQDLTRISGVLARIEDFERPFNGVQSQIVEYLHAAEEERARKYVQRTYDPERMTFTSSQLNVNLTHSQVYLPVWIFEFPYDHSEKYITFVAGWNASTSGPVFYQPEMSGFVGAFVGTIGAMLYLGSWNIFAGLGIGGILGLGIWRFLRDLPRFQRNAALHEASQQQYKDSHPRQEEWYDSTTGPEEDPYWSEDETYRSQQQRRQQTKPPPPKPPPPKYPSNDPQGLYKTLEIAPGASETEIRDSFRKLARKYHPDMVREGGPVSKEEAKVKFQEISAAYEVLKDPRKRREYDRFGTTST